MPLKFLLKVNKNRLGIGYIEKILKNKIKWVGVNENPALELEIKNLSKEYDKLCAEEKLLDYWIDKTNEDLQNFAKNEENTKYAFVTFNDIKNLKKNSDSNETFLIIKAPKGTTMELPLGNDEFGEGQEYPHQIFLHSENGEIIPFIVSDEKIDWELDNQKKQNEFNG